MKHLTITVIFLSSLAFAAEDSKDFILVSEVTEETYQDFLNQYSESCRPHVTRWVGAASLAAARFNEGRYLEASGIVERHVKPGDFKRRTGSAAIMFSEDCSVDDLRLTIAQGEALAPMLNSIDCLVRVADGDRDWAKAKETLDPDNLELENITNTIHYVESAMFAVDDVVDDGACRHLQEGHLQNILAVRAEWERVRDQLQTILEELEVTDES